MEPKTPKARLTIYVNPSLRRWLRSRSAESDRSVSEIAEDLMVRRIGRDAYDSEVREGKIEPVAFR